MSESDEQIGFVRQRRNIILISVLLFFAQAHEAHLSEINLLGTKVALSEPASLKPYLWIAFLYLLWRYISYFNEARGKSFFVTYRARMQKYIEKIALKTAEVGPLYKRLRSAGSSYIDQPSMGKWSLRATLILEKADGVHEQQEFPTVVTFPRLSVLQLRAWAYVIFVTPLFSEYIVPILIAAIPVTNWLSGGYITSLLRRL